MIWEFKRWLNKSRKTNHIVQSVLLSSAIKALRVSCSTQFSKALNMNEARRLKEKLKNCYLSGYFLDRNTFLKADDASVIMVPRKGDDGRVVDRPMIVLKNVTEMMVNHNGKIVAVENKRQLGVWVDAFEDALERYNEELTEN
jgi:hypothetical protein